MRKTIWSKGDGERGDAVRIIVIDWIGGEGRSSSSGGFVLAVVFGLVVGVEGSGTIEIVLRQTPRRGASFVQSFVLSSGSFHVGSTFEDPCS